MEAGWIVAVIVFVYVLLTINTIVDAVRDTAKAHTKQAETERRRLDLDAKREGLRYIEGMGWSQW